MKRALPLLSCSFFAVSAACGGGGDSAPDASVALPPAACAPPTQIVDTTGGHRIGDGTAASCTEAALDAALIERAASANTMREHAVVRDLIASAPSDEFDL